MYMYIYNICYKINMFLQNNSILFKFIPFLALDYSQFSPITNHFEILHPFHRYRKKKTEMPN